MYILIDIFCSLFALVMFIKELKKMQITQEEIDEWNSYSRMWGFPEKK